MKNELLSVKNLKKIYPGFVLQDVSFSLFPGRIMGLIGKNGAGKSTTLKALLNMVSPDGGEVQMFGKNFYQEEKAVLPVKKSEIVKAKCGLIISAQIGQLLVSIPFAVLRSLLGIPNNPVGLDATLSWYGIGLVIFSLFDLTFFPAYYKSGYKAGKSFLLALLPVIPIMLLAETAVHFPSLAWLDSTAPENLIFQLPILLFGLVCYACLLPLSCRIASKRFQKVDL